MPLKDKEVLRLVRKLVTWARRLHQEAQTHDAMEPCQQGRCSSCIENNEACPCDVSCLPGGTIRELMYQIVLNTKKINFERWKKSKLKSASKAPQNPSKAVNRVMYMTCGNIHRLKTADLPPPPTPNFDATKIAKQVLATLACRILTSGSLAPSITLLSRMATDHSRYSRLARTLLIQIISILSRFPSQRRLVSPSFPVCSLCGQTRPSSKTRQYIIREQYRRSCHMCRRRLRRLTANRSRDVLNHKEDECQKSMPSQLKPNYLPILVGTISVPLMPCPILISVGPVTSLLRRRLDHKQHTIGMALPASQYGTVLEVCDCIELADGSFILSTLGRGRFKIVKRVILQQCLVAKVKLVYDRSPSPASLPLSPYIEATGTRIVKLFDNFFKNLRTEVQNNIVSSYGPLRKYLDAGDDCENGPQYLWWMTAVLPLSDELKVHLISCEYLHKRMAVIQDALIKATVIYENINKVDASIVS